MAYFGIAARGIIARLGDMGSKYRPTIKDQKASQRYQQKQHMQSKFIKPAGKPPARKSKPK